MVHKSRHSFNYIKLFSLNTFHIFFNNKQSIPEILGMQNYTTMQHMKVVGFYYQSQQSIIQAKRKYRKYFKSWLALSISMIHSLVGRYRKQFKILRGSPFGWSPWSPQLTAPNFFLWDYLKDRVYINKSRTIIQLKKNIDEEIKALTPKSLTAVMKTCHRKSPPLWGCKRKTFK